MIAARHERTKKPGLKVVILAGGLGTRLVEETDTKPKPMVEIGGRPMLWHIMSIFAAHGHCEFVVALGYKGDVVKRYFLDFHVLDRDLTLLLADGGCQVHGHARMDWRIHLVDTGRDTQTGGRLRRLRDWVGDDTFMMTYGDAVANVDIGALVAFHHSHGKLATVTAVRPPARFGGLDLEGNRVSAFTEKVHKGDAWINGGFFVLEPRVLDEISGDDMPWEHLPVQGLTQRGELMAFRHEGFWHPMDTIREKRVLEALWDSGHAPWKIWE
jgi:glucose-1-phosphate cytidylyltransferase